MYQRQKFFDHTAIVGSVMGRSQSIGLNIYNYLGGRAGLTGYITQRQYKGKDRAYFNV